MDLANAILFGPDTLETEQHEDYSQNITHENFTNQVLANFEHLSSNDLVFSYSGIRPNIKIGGDKYPDFKLEFDNDSKIINLLGIDSPGLTSSLALANKVLDLIG